MRCDSQTSFWHVTLEALSLVMSPRLKLQHGRYCIWEKNSRFNEIFIMKMFNKSWKEIINSTIEWSTFCRANKKCQKYE
jgi:hypothetical protein